ncbi:energy-coupling factor transporter ATPase [Bacillus kwashiorkori]|uniref:energy-coupling factor transporter ATPase n=1 Tax=Bacillus kwashiorkori TaxID=1522318 RepID=UPI000783CB0B|nr:energy-coupling factor transporter ATPase [Bacillus kwashiorkori]
MQINFNNVSADYQVGPIRSPLILQAVDLSIQSKSFTAVVGHTGAGKSSLLKVINGLLLPKQGEVYVGTTTISAASSKKELKEVRQRVGMVFQFPEAQLFAETVEKDICFGPLNFGIPLNEAKKIARQVIQQVGLEEEILHKSPFSLSGGQKRRVAIAGILAMKPNILVLDEPGAGLDPNGKREIMHLIKSWHMERGLTTILVTHDMEDVAEYAEQVVIMDKGQVVAHDVPNKIFANLALLEKYHLSLPDARKLQIRIEKETGVRLPKICLTVDDLANGLMMAGLV